MSYSISIEVLGHATFSLWKNKLMLLFFFHKTSKAKIDGKSVFYSNKITKMFSLIFVGKSEKLRFILVVLVVIIQ